MSLDKCCTRKIWTSKSSFSWEYSFLRQATCRLQIPSRSVAFSKGWQYSSIAIRLNIYIIDYIDKYNLGKKFKFNCTVNNVEFDSKSEKFQLSWTEQAAGESKNKLLEFDYIMVATGHFSIPNNPSFKGEESFNGRLIHSHEYQDGNLYTNKRVLIIGGSFSAEDIALQCWKFGSAACHITHRRYHS